MTALYVEVDDEIGGTRGLGRPPLLSDSELVCLTVAVAQALLGFHSESRWLRQGAYPEAVAQAHADFADLQDADDIPRPRRGRTRRPEDPATSTPARPTTHTR